LPQSRVRLACSVLAAVVVAATAAWSGPACAEADLPPALAASLQRSGLPLASFGVYAEPVDGRATAALAALNTDRPFLLASTTKLVTSLAAMDLLGIDHRWRTRAYANAPVSRGRLAGDLVIAGSGAGMTSADLRRWFKAMHAQGLSEVSGRIVLDDFWLLHDTEPAQAAATAEEASPGATPEAREYHRGALVVAVAPGAGEKAEVSLVPRPLGISVLNDVMMGGGCTAWASWRSPQESGGAAQLWLRGRWDASCGRQEIAHVRPPPSTHLAPVPVATAFAGRTLSTHDLVARLWAEAGGKLRGKVVDADREPRARRVAHLSVAGDSDAPRAWSSEYSNSLAELMREMNKTSNNIAARRLLLSLGGPATDSPAGALRTAQDRVHAWLRRQGLAEGDMRIDVGSGQSRAERGTPRAMVQLLHNAWKAQGSQAFLDSLPIAGVDGTLVNRMRGGAAAGHAYLKTGTLGDTRALAGYVRARSGQVYAVAALANHAHAARATPALDAFIEWVAGNG
jgi:D-alanyl-D-alanine carboxypeptidase/D-alanyl-D-alanine-endopeptidase (penicillin-binding protein 4)